MSMVCNPYNLVEYTKYFLKRQSEDLKGLSFLDEFFKWLFPYLLPWPMIHTLNANWKSAQSASSSGDLCAWSKKCLHLFSSVNNDLWVDISQNLHKSYRIWLCLTPALSIITAQNATIRTCCSRLSDSTQGCGVGSGTHCTVQTRTALQQGEPLSRWSCTLCSHWDPRMVYS